jgi:hypothetical protein
MGKEELTRRAKLTMNKCEIRKFRAKGKYPVAIRKHDKITNWWPDKYGITVLSSSV